MEDYFEAETIVKSDADFEQISRLFAQFATTQNFSKIHTIIPDLHH